jgi:hypothetical protein
LAENFEISNPDKWPGDDENVWRRKYYKHVLKITPTKKKKSYRSGIDSNREDITMKGREKIRVALAPLSIAVTKILCSIFGYEGGFSVMNTIITKLSKKLLTCNIPPAMFTKQRTSVFHMEYHIVHEVRLAEDPQTLHVARGKGGETREIWKLLLLGESL